MNQLFLNEDDKALTMKLYEKSSKDPYIGVSTMAKKKLITNKNIANWQINTNIKYIEIEDIVSSKEKLYSLDTNFNRNKEQIERFENDEFDLVDSHVSLILSSKRPINSNSNIQHTPKKIKTETFVGLSQECTYTTNNSEILESDNDNMLVMETGYIRGDTILTFVSETSEG